MRYLRSVGREDQEQAAVRALLPHLPLVFECGGEVLDGLAIERLDGDHGNLRVGLAIHLQRRAIQEASVAGDNTPAKSLT